MQRVRRINVDVGRHSRRLRERARIIGQHLVDDGEARFGRGDMPGIERASDRGGEHHVATFLQPDEGVGLS